MDELSRDIAKFASILDKAMERVGIEKLTKQAQKLEIESQKKDFWSDRPSAEENMKQQARLGERLKPWLVLKKELKEVQDLVKFGDESLKDEINIQLQKTKAEYKKLKGELKYNAPFDESDAIVSIYSGAGGTDAQDWAEMLYNMYIKWANQSKLKVNSIATTPADEAGIKSAVLEVSGSFAYGKLKGEHGVHRLVRLSPYNADNLRQTSFAKVEVMPKIDKPSDLVIDEKELKIDVYRSGGRGGQSVNTTDSAVRITHIPTGITVSIQNERSQLQNKETAMTILRSRLVSLQLEQHKEKLSELKGPNQSAEWGNQIRSYVLHPYKQVKDLRTHYESKDPAKVLAGELDGFIDAYLELAPKS